MTVLSAASQARLRVALLSLPMRTRAVMEYFILGPGRGMFSQSVEGDADVVIVDYDNPESRSHWDNFRAGRQRPAIVLSMVPVDLPDMIWIQKPATPAALLAAAARLAANARGTAPAVRLDPFSVAVAAAHLRGAGTGLVERRAPPEPEVPIEPEPVAQPAPLRIVTTPAFDEQRYCGTRPDLTPQEIAADPSMFYRLEGTLLYVLKDAFFVARKWTAQTRIDRPEGGIAFDPRENRAYLGCSEEALRDTCVRRLEAQVRVQTMTTRDFTALRDAPSGSVEIVRADALLWEVALQSSIGRLPVGTRLDQTVYVKAWPNLTRIAPLPNAMRIVALFAVRGATLAEAPRLLNVPQRHVFACFNGLAALDLITYDGSKLRAGGEKPHKHRAIIQRLFRWLRGKA